MFKLSRNGEVPTGAVVVRVWKLLERHVADVALTPAPVTDVFEEASPPLPVPVALKRAQHIQQQRRVPVVIVLEPGADWWPRWAEELSIEAEEPSVNPKAH